MFCALWVKGCENGREASERQQAKKEKEMLGPSLFCGTYRLETVYKGM